MQTRDVAIVVVFALSCIILYASMRGFFNNSEPQGILESYRKIGSFQNWAYDKQIGLVRRIAPDKFQDPSVRLNEMARDLEHLTSGNMFATLYLVRMLPLA